MGMVLLKGNETSREVIYLAYGLEEGLRKYYSMSAELAIDPKIVSILTKLADIEVKHKQRLFDVYLTIDPTTVDMEAFENNVASELVEGGFDLDKLLEQSRKTFKTAARVLDFAMTLEAQAMDLYMRYAQRSEDPAVKNLFLDMANEEKSHLKSLGDLLDKYIDFA
jgi:rubrerythrin